MPHRFFVSSELLPGADLELSDPALVHQLARVLKFAAGERIVLCDGKGKETEATISAIADAAVTVRTGEVAKNKREPLVDVALYCAVLKRENFEFVVQKSIETGASSIVPLITKRTVKQNVDVERLRRIAKEAAEQCGRGILPMVSEPMDFAAAFDQAIAKGAHPIVYSCGEDELRPEIAPHVALFIGPEGGWEPSEVELARSKSAMLAGLGPLTLRAETAAAIATWLAAHP